MRSRFLQEGRRGSSAPTLPLMKKPVVFLACAALLGAAITSCDTAKQQRETGRQVTAEQVNPRTMAGLNSLDAQEKNGLIVTPYANQQRAMSEAALQVAAPSPSAVLEPGAVRFSTNVTNFRLGAQATVREPGITMSPLGQSITTIIDNEVVTEHGTTSFSENMEEGDHTVLTFLTRPNRESLKHRLAYDLRTVQVGRPEGVNDFNPKAAHIFYNLPRGTYVGDEADRILLDFFLVNTQLEEEGTQVRLTINKTPFTLARWTSYVLEGLPMGPNKIKLELIDANGAVIPGPYNSVTKTITLRPGA